MSETINNTVPNEDIPQDGVSSNNEEKTFTQDELNRIVSDRLQRERKKLEAAQTGEYTAELAEREKVILQRELQMDAKERLEEAVLPVSIATLLRYDDEEAYNKSYNDVVTVFGDIIQDGVTTRVNAVLSGEPPKAAIRISSDPIKNAFAPKK